MNPSAIAAVVPVTASEAAARLEALQTALQAAVPSGQEAAAGELSQNGVASAADVQMGQAMPVQATTTEPIGTAVTQEASGNWSDQLMPTAGLISAAILGQSASMLEAKSDVAHQMHGESSANTELVTGASGLASSDPGGAINDAAQTQVALASRGHATRRNAAAELSEAAQPTQPSTPDVAPSDSAMPGGATLDAAAIPLAPTLLSAMQAGSTQTVWTGTHLASDDDIPRRDRRGGKQDNERHGGFEQPTDDDPDSKHGGLPDFGFLHVLERHEAQAMQQQETDSDWCAQLIQSLRGQWRDPKVRPLLSIALAQWQRARCVMLACPQNALPGSQGDSGWLFALRHDGTTPSTILSGERFSARLSWHRQVREKHWWGVRAAKHQGLQLGRRLMSQAELPEPVTTGPVGPEAMTTAATNACSLALQLGPAITSATHAQVLDIRVDAVPRLWTAMRSQWSVVVLACDHPLVGVQPANAGASP